MKKVAIIISPNYKDYAEKYLYGARKQTRSLRKTKDKDITKMITGRIWYQEIDDVKLRLVNLVFEFYWGIVRKLIVW